MRARALHCAIFLWALALGCSDPKGPYVGTTTRVDASVEAGASETIRVATFNVRQLFDTQCDSAQCGAGDFEQELAPLALEARAEAIAKSVRSMGPSVLALQEIETQAALDAVSARLVDVLPFVAMGETGAPGSLDVAVLSAYPITSVRRHRDRVLVRTDGTTTSFARELLEVAMVGAGGRRIVLFAAHFRSKNNDDPERRLLEARAAGQILTERAAEMPDALCLLAGDLNDTPGSEPLSALEEASGLYRVASDLPLSEQGTYLWRGTLQAIDHILLSGPRGAYIAGSARVEREAEGRGLADSDHAALRADFR